MNRTSIVRRDKRRHFPLVHSCLAILAVCLSLCAGCSRRTSDLEAELARLEQENEALKKELEEVVKLSKKLDELLKSYEEMAPQVTGIQNEIDATRDYISKIEALTPEGINERGRAELKLLIEEVMAAENERRLAEQQQWAEDLKDRHLDELAAFAHLSPEQKKKVTDCLQEEQEQVNDAYSQLAQGLARADDIKRAREDARIEKDKRIKSLLAADQYRKFKEWERQRDMFRAGINRRQQSPNSNQDDL